MMMIIIIIIINFYCLMILVTIYNLQGLVQVPSSKIKVSDLILIEKVGIKIILCQIVSCCIEVHFRQ